MNDKANKERALELCCEYIEKGSKMMSDAILCISALENDDDIQECIAKVVSCFNVSIEFVVAAVNSHRNGGHACGECKRFGNKASLKCVYRGENHPACDDFEQRGQITSSDILRESDTVPVVTENAETESVKVKSICNNCFWWNKTCHNKKSCCYGDQKDYNGFCGWFEPANAQTNVAAEIFKAQNHDAVNHPSHYTAGGIECIDALKAATVGLTGIEAVCTANAIKYLWRQSRKNGVEDLKKAIWYIERLIKEKEENGNS